jgi:hypothetical protein
MPWRLHPSDFPDQPDATSLSSAVSRPRGRVPEHNDTSHHTNPVYSFTTPVAPMSNPYRRVMSMLCNPPRRRRQPPHESAATSARSTIANATSASVYAPDSCEAMPRWAASPLNRRSQALFSTSDMVSAIGALTAQVRSLSEEQAWLAKAVYTLFELHPPPPSASSGADPSEPNSPRSPHPHRSQDILAPVLPASQARSPGTSVASGSSVHATMTSRRTDGVVLLFRTLLSSQSSGSERVHSYGANSNIPPCAQANVDHVASY